MNIDFFSAEQLKENYENFRKRVNLYFKDNTERLDALNKMYDHFEERMVFTPASSTDYFHNAFPGGYIDHVMRVVDNCIIVYCHRGVPAVYPAAAHNLQMPGSCII